jgi:hypothetical protein
MGQRSPVGRAGHRGGLHAQFCKLSDGFTPLWTEGRLPGVTCPSAARWPVCRTPATSWTLVDRRAPSSGLSTTLWYVFGDDDKGFDPQPSSDLAVLPRRTRTADGGSSTGDDFNLSGLQEHVSVYRTSAKDRLAGRRRTLRPRRSGLVEPVGYGRHFRGATDRRVGSGLVG